LDAVDDAVASCDAYFMGCESDGAVD